MIRFPSTRFLSRPALLALAPALLTLWANPAAAQAGGEDAVAPVAPEMSMPAEPELEPEPAMMLKLRSGQIRWGRIVDHDPDGFHFSLLSHGGVAQVPWSALDPAQQESLRQRFGYVDIASDELLVDVERLILVDGHEVVGVVLSREGPDFVVQVDGNLQIVPKRRVQSLSKGGQIPALDVYSREELYARHAAQVAPDDLEGQIALARTCERFLDFQHALEHYEAALVLDSEEAHPELVPIIASTIEKAEQQEQIDYLRQVDTLRKRGQFEEALNMSVAFAVKFPESPLLGAAQAKEKQVLQSRDAALTNLVRLRWNIWMARLCRQAAGQLDYAGAVAFAEEGLGEAIRAKVLEEVKKQSNSNAAEEEVVAYWVARKKVRFLNASYGAGTWLLGEDKANAGTEDLSAQRESMSQKDKEREALEEKIQRFLKNQRAARQARAQAAQEDEFQAFWNGFSLSKRANWIRAYYVEFGGDYELRDHARLKPCSSCGGRGVHEVIYAGGGGKSQSSGVTLVPCPLCRGIGIVRIVYYR